jgi:glycosyltransferase involved in cell wall biosynthesis
MINIFILCYNESVLLPHTVKHYKTYLPSCKITIFDNESTDNSVEIAKSLGCNVISWSSKNIIDDYKYRFLKNNGWKGAKEGWVIVIDMDEWLCITEDELNYEKKQGTTILKIQGLEMIGESKTLDVSDINLHTINKYLEYDGESKNLCFLRESISDINYEMGAHFSNPTGNVKYSAKTYYNRHMSNLGLPYLLNKMNKRFERSEEMRRLGFATHYSNDEEKVRMNYMNLLSFCKTF